MHKGLLEQSKRYRKFIRDRDQALEQIHQNAQVDFSRIVHESLVEIEKLVTHLAVKGKKTVLNLGHLTLQLERGTYAVFEQLIGSLIDRQQRMRRAVYSLAYLGQAEAIGQVSKKPHPPKLSKTKIQKVHEMPTVLDDDLEHRVWLSCMSFRSRVLQAFRLALVQELPVEEVLAKVKKQFPKLVIYKKPPRKLKVFKEAKRDGTKDEFLNTDFIDEDEWQSIVDDYKDTQLPRSRFDNEAFDAGAGPDDQAQYAWEAEQNLTEDFVQSVRKGEVDAANDMGIQEFVWVAILDDKTDDCCAERNGLTTSEIAGKVDQEDFDSECDALYPPAHMNCRCQLSPVASADQVEGPDWASFQDWLDAA